MSLSTFFDLVKHGPFSDSGLFNPWRDFDPEYDVSSEAPIRRYDHLKRYMESRQETAKYLLIAEAPGYCGAKFSGLAMTSERDLLANNMDLFGDSHFFPGVKHRTSKKLSRLKNEHGMLERTATIVWSSAFAVGLKGADFVLWNSLAFHPYGKSRLSNRSPANDEVLKNRKILEHFLDAFPGRPIIAIGNVCRDTMKTLGIEVTHVRHPSFGGATEFRAGLERIVNG